MRVHALCLVLPLSIFLLHVGCGGDRTTEETFVRELAHGEGAGPQSLMNQAQTARGPEKKLAIFERIVAAYPDSPQADEAQFMIGFILHEDLSRYEDAQAAFDILFEKYPDSDWIDDAKSILAGADSLQDSP